MCAVPDDKCSHKLVIVPQNHYRPVAAYSHRHILKDIFETVAPVDNA